MATLLAGMPDPRNNLRSVAGQGRPRLTRAHIEGPSSGRAGCQHELRLVHPRPAVDVPEDQRCQRKGCRASWPRATGDTRVYVASPRPGVRACRPTGDGITGCGHSTRPGLIYRADTAIEQLHVTWCEQCWTPGAGLDRMPGVPDPAGQPKPIPARSIWRDRDLPARRLRIHLVTRTTVIARITYSVGLEAWRGNLRTVEVPRDDWHRLYRPETADDLRGAR